MTSDPAAAARSPPRDAWEQRAGEEHRAKLQKAEQPLLLAAPESRKRPALSCPLSACVAPATVTEKDTVPLPDRGRCRKDPEETDRQTPGCYLRGEGFQLLTQAHSVYCRL